MAEIFPETYGAVGNGITDDQNALEDALAALAPGDTLILKGIYAHSYMLYEGANNVTIRGGGTLKATVQATSAVKILGNNVTIEDISLTLSGRTSRGTSGDHHKLFVENCSGFVGRRIRIDNSHGTGITLYRATDYLIDSCVVKNTAADGIHNTFSSKRGRIVNCTCEATEDDGISVVSYENDGDECEDIIISGANVFNQTVSGRGLTCVGGINIRFYDFEVATSHGAGVYVACEAGDYQTFGSSNVVFERGRIKVTNIGAPVVDHGAILVSCDRESKVITDVTIRDISILNTYTGASRVLGILRTAGTVSQVLMEDLRIEGDHPPSIFATFGSPGYTLRRIYVSGVNQY